VEKLYDGVHCRLTIERLAGDVVLVRISGTYTAEFGDGPMRDVAALLDNPIYFFVDARDVRGASIEVSGQWAVWLRRHKARLKELSIVTGSRLIEVTVDFVRRFAGLEEIMRTYTDPAAFDAALESALARK
jgi:hypothetical protein